MRSLGQVLSEYAPELFARTKLPRTHNDYLSQDKAFALYRKTRLERIKTEAPDLWQRTQLAKSDPKHIAVKDAIAVWNRRKNLKRQKEDPAFLRSKKLPTLKELNSICDGLMLPDDNDELRKRLMQLRLQDRLGIMATDLSTGARKFVCLDPASIALAAGLEDVSHPGSTWFFTNYADHATLEDLVSKGLQIEHLLERIGQNLPSFYVKSLAKQFGETTKERFDFLSSPERAMLESEARRMQKEANANRNTHRLAVASIPVIKEVHLRFEAMLDEAGNCTRLRTPYSSEYVPWTHKVMNAPKSDTGKLGRASTKVE